MPVRFCSFYEILLRHRIEDDERHSAGKQDIIRIHLQGDHHLVPMHHRLAVEE